MGNQYLPVIQYKWCHLPETLLCHLRLSCAAIATYCLNAFGIKNGLEVVGILVLEPNLTIDKCLRRYLAERGIT
jgi:hypothetical protein